MLHHCLTRNGSVRWPCGLLLLASVTLATRAAWAAETTTAAPEGGSGAAPSVGDDLRWQPRLEAALDRWCRWLAVDLYRIPGTDLYTMNPTLGTGRNPYRDVAGNQFAAAAAGYWLGRNQPEPEIAGPLRGLIRLALGTHVAVQSIDRPDIQKWGATLSHADDWHADLFAAAQGMLMLDTLDPEQREQLRAILAWEADKQTEYGVSRKWRTWPGRWPEHSCGESNAWSAALQQIARIAWPGDDRQEAWRQAAIDLSLNAICLPADMTSDTIVAGRPLSERVKGANFEPGGIQEHHGFYHPGYMGWPLAYQAYAWLMDRELPEPGRDPDVYLHNWKHVYDRLKQGTSSNGRFIYAAGYDWITYGYGNAQFMPAAIFAAAHFRDPDATRMADEWLKLVEFRQRIGGGSVHGATLGTIRRLRANDFSWYEAQEGCCLAQALWVLDRVDTGAIPPPSTQEAFNRRNTGTYIEPNAVLAWHRDPRRWASASWRSALGQWQMVVQPVELPHLLKFNHNGVGLIEGVGTTDERKVEWCRMEALEHGGFWSMGCVGRLGKRVIHGRPDNRVFPMVRQYQAMIALPHGPTVLVDVCRTLDQLWLLRSGGLGLRLAADVFNGGQVNIEADGRAMRFGQADCRDEWHDLNTRAVTIENRLTIRAISGEGSFRLLQKRRRAPEHDEMASASDLFGEEESLLAHELYFGPPAGNRARVLNPGEQFRRLVLVFDCEDGSTRAGTGAATDRPDPGSQADDRLSGDFPCLAIELDDCTLVVNFDDEPARNPSRSGPQQVSPRSVIVTRPDR